MEAWIGWAVAGLLGVLTGWLILRTRRIIVTYRGRVARVRENWETVEERLADALKRVSRLEAELVEKKRELARLEAVIEELLREKAELSKNQLRADVELAPPKDARRTSGS